LHRNNAQTNLKTEVTMMFLHTHINSLKVSGTFEFMLQDFTIHT